MAQNHTYSIDRKEFLRRSTIVIAGLGITGCPSSGKLQQSTVKNSLHFRTLGRTDLKVSFVAHGASRVEVPSVVRRSVDSGINFVDTGRMYSEGKNELMLGKALKDVRKKIIIQSKFHIKLRNNRAGIEKSIEESLKALQTDYIDIMLFRGVSSKEEVNSPEVFEALAQAKEKGMIRFSGISCHSNQAETLQAVTQGKFYDVVMVSYNHAGNFTHSQSGRFSEWDQAALEKEIVKATGAGIGIIAMKTCSAGPYKAQGESKATFSSALKWIRKNPHISTTVPGMANFAEVEEDIKAMGKV